MTGRRVKDRGDARRFLEKLDPCNSFTFQTFDDSDDKRKSLVEVPHGSLEENFTLLEKLNDRGAGIFVTINKTDLKGRKTLNIERIRAVFVDLDGAP